MQSIIDSIMELDEKDFSNMYIRKIQFILTLLKLRPGFTVVTLLPRKRTTEIIKSKKLEAVKYFFDNVKCLDRYLSFTFLGHKSTLLYVYNKELIKDVQMNKDYSTDIERGRLLGYVRPGIPQNKLYGCVLYVKNTFGFIFGQVSDENIFIDIIPMVHKWNKIVREYVKDFPGFILSLNHNNKNKTMSY